jgi:hypothetical protein
LRLKAIQTDFEMIQQCLNRIEERQKAREEQP